MFLDLIKYAKVCFHFFQRFMERNNESAPCTGKAVKANSNHLIDKDYCDEDYCD